MQLILIRHGQTDWNKEYRVQGQSDLSLNQSGKAQAYAIAEALKDTSIEAIYSSPLNRAFETAQSVNRFHDVTITPMEGLKELDVGLTDGLYYPDLKTRYPDFFEKWTTDPASARFPDGETLPELQERVWTSTQSILAANHKKSVVITSHFFSLLTLLCKVLGLDLSHFRRLNISVASISTVEFNEHQIKLTTFNQTYHLTANQ